MSIYYELRMTGKLSFKNKEDVLSLKIKSFFKSFLEIEEHLRYKSKLKLILEKDFILNQNTIEDKYTGVINTWCPETYVFELENDYVDEDDGKYLLIKIEEINPDVFGVDFCIGNKNQFSCMELFTLLLIEYMEDDFKLVYYNESSTEKLNFKKDSLSKYIKENIEDIENSMLGYLIFDALDTEANSILEKDEEYEIDWLREGLIIKGD